MKKIENWSDYLDSLVDIAKSIDFDKITILTGGNGRGKSVIRKQLTAIGRHKNIKLWSCSMDDRAGVNPNVMMVFGRDCEWLPTSINTFSNIKGFYDTEDSFGILDEIEIGMSEETQYGVALYINQHLKEFRSKNHGMLIITHSRWLVRTINADVFVNLEGMTKEEWLNREIVPTNFDELESDSDKLYCEIEKRLR